VRIRYSIEKHEEFFNAQIRITLGVLYRIVVSSV